MSNGYQKQLQHIAKVKSNTPAATWEAVDRAISIFYNRSLDLELSSMRMHTLLLMAKFKGARASDMLQLCWQQIEIKEKVVLVKPVNYKNARFASRWKFKVPRWKDQNDLGAALLRLKRSDTKTSSDGKIFGKFKTANLNYFFKKYETSIGELLSMHRIRVLVDKIVTDL